MQDVSTQSLVHSCQGPGLSYVLPSVPEISQLQRTFLFCFSLEATTSSHQTSFMYVFCFKIYKILEDVLFSLSSFPTLPLLFSSREKLFEGVTTSQSNL